MSRSCGLIRRSGVALSSAAPPTSIHFSVIPSAPARASSHHDGRRRAGRQRRRIDLDYAARHTDPMGDELLGERRRRAAVRQPVLIAVPRTGDAAVDDTAFAERTVLMSAQIGNGADLVAVAEDRDALAPRRGDDAGALVGNRRERPDREPAGACGASPGRAIGLALAPAG